MMGVLEVVAGVVLGLLAIVGIVFAAFRPPTHGARSWLPPATDEFKDNRWIDPTL